MPSTSFDTFVNAHTHSHSIPLKGTSGSAPFEVWLSYRLAVRIGGLTPEQQVACALAVGLENLEAGNAGIIDHLYSPLTPESVYGVAEAYESLGVRAWVFPNVDDLPVALYSKRYYPDYPKAIPDDELPQEARDLIEPAPFQPRLEAAKKLIKGWRGNRVQMGLALGNPVWCSDELLEAAVDVLKELDVPLEIHAEESPVQREVSLAQWGMSGIQRLDSYGLLSPRTLVAHCVQASEEDVAILGKRGVSVSHNPLSNLKLHNGIGPIGRMLKAGVNVTLGSDGPNSADMQSLFPVMRMVACLARLNGIQEVNENIEEQVVKMASSHGRNLWFPAAMAEDRVEYAQPIDPVRLVWTDAASSIKEVYVGGEPVLEKARALVEERRAHEIVASLFQEAMRPGGPGPDLAQRCRPLIQRYARSI